MGIVNEILNSNNVSWHLARVSCADDAPAMLGENSGFMAFLR
jgi:hypothetical protein